MYVRTYVCVCKYVCMYVCIYVCTYVHTYIRRYVHTYIRMYVNNLPTTYVGLKGDNDTDDGTCKPLSKSDYIHLVWTTCAEFPGQPLPLM